MTWTQTYTPVAHSLLASALVAAIPVVVLLGLLAFFHVRAHFAALAGLGFFWIAFDEEKQSWHDKIAGTRVIRVR